MFGFKNKFDLRNESTEIQPKVNYNARNRLDEINEWYDKKDYIGEIKLRYTNE